MRWVWVVRFVFDCLGRVDLTSLVLGFEYGLVWAQGREYCW